MANNTHIRSFIQSWEGGLSRSTSDAASANPAPWLLNGVGGYHTNKGITFSTFSNLAPSLGYDITADDFFNMPDAVWNSIFKNGYWDVWGLDGVNSQAIADLLADFSWGSGAAGSLRSIEKYLATKGYSVSNFSQAVAALNELSAGNNEENIFLELIKWRENFYVSLSEPGNIEGWLNRLERGEGPKQSLLQFGLQTIKKKNCLL